MKIIERTEYLSTLKDLVNMHTPDIKILTGVRRSGKSKLLETLKKYIINEIPDSHVIHINYNLIDFLFLRF